MKGSLILNLLATLILMLSEISLAEDQILGRAIDDLETKTQDLTFDQSRFTPLIIGYYEQNNAQPSRLEDWAMALKTLLNGPVIICEPCQQESIRQSTDGLSIMRGPLPLASYQEFDQERRSNSAIPAAKAVMFIRDSGLGFSYRIVDIHSGEILLASTVGVQIDLASRSVKHFTLRRELNRRSRGETIVHGIYDVGAYPNPHLAASWLEQWGPGNQYLTGFTVTAINPILGLGVSAFKVLPSMGNLMLGGQVLVSLPTALSDAASSSGNDQENNDALLTFVGMIRYPINISSTSMVIAYISSGGAIGVGMAF